jgi:hypothetical protein
LFALKVIKLVLSTSIKTFTVLPDFIYCKDVVSQSSNPIVKKCLKATSDATKGFSKAT